MNKQKNTSAARDSKDNIAPTSHGDALRAFYGRMSATTSQDHPWMLEFAGIIAAHEDAGTEQDGKLDAVDNITLATETLDALLSLALQVCSDRGNIDNAASAIRAARRYVVDINETAAFMTGAAA
jgi:hypothetical protein